MSRLPAGRGARRPSRSKNDPARPLRREEGCEAAGFHVSSGLPSAPVGCTVVGRDEAIGVVVAHYPATAGEGVLVECAGVLILAQLAQIGGEPAGRGEGFGAVVA